MFMDIMSEVVKSAYLMFKNRGFSVDFTPVHTKQLTLSTQTVYFSGPHANCMYYFHESFQFNFKNS